MITVTKDELLKSGAHFGHVTSKTDPNFRDYVISQKMVLILSILKIQ